MEESREHFLARWSRLKRAGASEAPAAAACPAEAAAAAELPAPDTLEFGSDFTVFLQPNVAAPLRCAALKKLFHSGQFNTMDGLDVYVDDYSKFEPISAEMLRRLQHARGLLFPPEEERDSSAGTPHALPGQAAQGSEAKGLPMQAERVAAEAAENPARMVASPDGGMPEQAE